MTSVSESSAQHVSKGAKAALVVEIVLCFGPLFVLLALGASLVPLQLDAIVNVPIEWQGPASLALSVVCGAIGLTTLAFVVSRLLADGGP
ncbi:MAG: hypothetical protein AAFX10_16780, partial [Pseudomonadota bacterium]